MFGKWSCASTWRPAGSSPRWLLLLLLLLWLPLCITKPLTLTDVLVLLCSMMPS
jgi:hypothetical protein